MRETLGDEGVSELITLVDERVREQAVPRDEYQQVIIRLDTLERDVGELRREMIDRFTRVDERFIEMDRHFEVRFEEMNRHIEVRFEEMNRHSENRFDKMEQRLERRLDSRLDEMNRRLDETNQRLDEMSREINRRLDEMYDRMLVQSRWLIGSIALLGTVISILLGIGQFVK
ncbi:MAG: hypothetical protein ACE5LU_08285 [Anaerolineae bacterium]